MTHTATATRSTAMTRALTHLFDLAIALAVGAIILGAMHALPTAPDRITEDSAGWDCRTMGNELCAHDIREHQNAGDIPGWEQTFDLEMAKVEAELAKPFPWETGECQPTGQGVC